MCFCAWKPTSRVLPKWMLENAFSANDDGAGFAFSYKGELILRKGFFEFKDFWREFNKIQKGNPAILHMRAATTGSKNKKNCHPFLVNENLAVAHNGILVDWIGTDKSDKSDTRWFVEAMLQPLFDDVPDAHLNPVYQCLLEKTIDTGNKLIFLDNKGQHSIIRAHAGHYVKGCWLSNESYKIPRQKVKTNSTTSLYDNWIKKNGPRKFKPTNETERILGGPSQLGRVPFEKQKLIPFEFDRRDGNAFRKIIEMQEQGILGDGDLRQMMV